MKPKPTLLFLSLTACAVPLIEPTADEADVTDLDDKIITDDNDTDRPEENDLDAEPEAEHSQGSSDFFIVSGIWRVDRATLIADTCDWDTQLRQFFGVGADELLPDDFTVVGEAGAFEIEANAYGASGPILCSLTEAEFSCETQSVTPEDFDLGSMGWTYAIDFSGEVNNERSLFGAAEVSFPTVSEFLAPVFQALGVDSSQCKQTFELSLSIQE